MGIEDSDTNARGFVEPRLLHRDLMAYTDGHCNAVLDPFAGVGTTLIEADLA